MLYCRPFALALVGLISGTYTGTGHAQIAWINELHYDNLGNDEGEFVEVVLGNAAYYNLSNFSVYLYNGSDGRVYSEERLDTFEEGETVGGYTVYTWSPGGLQNGPDGVALAYQDSILQFLSYDGQFVASEGPAQGRESDKIPIGEETDTPVGWSIQLSGTGTYYNQFNWTPPGPHSPGLENVAQSITTLILRLTPSTSHTGPSSDLRLELETQGVSEADLELAGIGCKILYPSGHFALNTVTPGNFISTDTLLYVNADEQNGEIGYSTVSTGGSVTSTVDGTIATIDFKARPGIVTDTLVYVRISDGLASGSDGTVYRVLGTPAAVELSAGPSLAVSVDSLHFGTIDFQSQSTRHLTLSNTGGIDLHIDQLASSDAHFDLLIPQSILPPDSSMALAVTYLPGAIENHSTTISISSNSITGSPHQIAAYGTGGTVVWPGDTDNDGDVDPRDVLPLGYHYGRTGPQRGLQIEWEGRSVAPWNPIDATYADATGDGEVNQNDLHPIGINFGIQRSGGKNNRTESPTPSGRSVPIDPLPADTQFVLSLGVSSAEDSVSGIAVSAQYPGRYLMPMKPLPSPELDNGDLIRFTRIDPETSQISVAYVRKRHAGGVENPRTLVYLPFHVLESLPSSAVIELDEIAVSIQGGSSQTSTTDVIIETRGDSTMQDNAFNQSPPPKFSVEDPYPNPADQQSTILLGIPESGSITGHLYDLTGRLQYRFHKKAVEPAARHTITVPLQGLPDGSYFLHLNYEARADADQQSKTVVIVKTN